MSFTFGVLDPACDTDENRSSPFEQESRRTCVGFCGTSSRDQMDRTPRILPANREQNGNCSILDLPGDTSSWTSKRSGESVIVPTSKHFL